MKRFILIITLLLVGKVHADIVTETASTYTNKAKELLRLGIAEESALENEDFKAAREALKKSFSQKAELISRTVVPFGGQKTKNPSTSYLVIERWYAFDQFQNIIAEVTLRTFPRNKPEVKLKTLASGE